MNKELLKPLILGISFIVGMIIYTEQTKYELYSDNIEGVVKYSVINRSNGDVSTFFINNNGSVIYESNIKGDVEIKVKKDE